jgi:hypothetical protein
VRLNIVAGYEQRTDTVFAFLSASLKGERLSYRGYTLEISKDKLGWRLGVHPSQPDLPFLARCNFTVTYPRKDDALWAAYRRIDLLLSV